jgi:hypothetical protein
MKTYIITQQGRGQAPPIVGVAVHWLSMHSDAGDFEWGLPSRPQFHTPVVVKLNNSTGRQGGAEEAVYPCMFIALNSSAILGNLADPVPGV